MPVTVSYLCVVWVDSECPSWYVLPTPPSLGRGRTAEFDTSELAQRMSIDRSASLDAILHLANRIG